MKIFNSSQIELIDEYTIKQEPVSSLLLMERAAMAFITEFVKEIDTKRYIIVLAGSGNNGGDALAIARLLLLSGYSVKVILYNLKNKLSKDCDKNKQYLSKLLSYGNLDFIEVKQDIENSINLFKNKLDNSVIIDGLFGSGLNRAITGEFVGLIEKINSESKFSRSTIISIDLPSGLFIDENLLENNKVSDNNPIIKAKKTISFQFPKLPFMLPDYVDFVGNWKTVDIGLYKNICAQTLTRYHYTIKEDVAILLKHRNKFSHKGNFGHALLIAGSRQANLEPLYYLQNQQ